MFRLNERLAADTFEVGDLTLCKLLLFNDSRYRWFILVPRIVDVTEIHHLNTEQRQLLMQESCQLAEFISEQFDVDKMNVGVLGNIVSQLHVHHIGRRTDDPAWPGPVWGHSAAVAYADTEAEGLISLAQSAFNVS